MTKGQLHAHGGGKTAAAMLTAMHARRLPGRRLLVPLLALAIAPPALAEPNARLTTDTVEYCQLLSARFDALPAGKQDPARSLGTEGQRLCRSGHVRIGVAKLRRAIRAAQSAD